MVFNSNIRLHLLDINNIPLDYKFYNSQDLENRFYLQSNKNNIDEKILKNAVKLFHSLVNSMNSEDEKLLHGDLHHENLVKNKGDWLVIDPKGIIGDRALEPASYIYNPIDKLINNDNYLSIINKRIDLFSEILKIKRQRIYDWFYLKCLFRLIWAVENNLDSKYFRKLISELK